MSNPNKHECLHWITEKKIHHPKTSPPIPRKWCCFTSDSSADSADSDANRVTSASDTIRWASHACHSETMDEQSNFTQACIRSGRPRLQTPTARNRSYHPGWKIFGNGDRKLVKERTGTGNAWQARCLYATFLISTNVRTVSSTTQPDGKKNKIYIRLPGAPPDTDS